MGKVMSQARARIVISGKVQGVYFRARTQEQAFALKVMGWVKNSTGGTVEGVFEGNRENVEKLIDWCRQGPPKAVVSGVQVEWEDYRGEFSSFVIAYR
ncbi:MAG: Acylphosphatase [Pelotomaculum sp. PtaU1.Bin035]|nr:MAG: Acylphosphatase [Pelotomaculum sp. PtaU1.Bin035]